jgi:glycosyltransferase involved in cell wall biosynthesis
LPAGLGVAGRALQHYALGGERAGLMASPMFDPGDYLAANPALAEFVDRPLFHYLKVGRAAGLPVRPVGPHRRPRPAAKPRIAAQLGVKDEVELIERSISHLRSIGVDHILVCDMSSTDGTAEILERYRGDDVSIMTLSHEDISGASDEGENWETKNLERARRAGADWIIFLDADEFWLPASGSLKDCTALEAADVVSVQRFNVPLGPDGPMLPDALAPEHYDGLLLLTQGISDLQRHMQEHPQTPWIRVGDPPKFMARPAALTGFAHGMHDVRDAADGMRRSRADDLIVAHLPMSTRSRFDVRVDNIRRYYELEGIDPASAEFDWRNTDNPTAWHWRRWAMLADLGETGAEFDRNVFSQAQLDSLREQGVIRSAAELLGRGMLDLGGA